MVCIGSIAVFNPFFTVILNILRLLLRFGPLAGRGSPGPVAPLPPGRLTQQADACRKQQPRGRKSRKALPEGKAVATNGGGGGLPAAAPGRRLFPQESGKREEGLSRGGANPQWLLCRAALAYTPCRAGDSADARPALPAPARLAAGRGEEHQDRHRAELAAPGAPLARLPLCDIGIATGRSGHTRPRFFRRAAG
jgi:hypothetical protein